MMRFLEFYKSLPMILILLVLLAILPKQTMTGLSIIIGFLIWPSFYRYIRASILEQKQESYYEALVNLGYSHWRIMFVHFVPKVFRIIMIPVIVSIISIILFEATLSFLGIGIEEGVVSWGRIIADARKNFGAWWLALFPGLAIYILIVSLNIIGDHGLQKLDKA